MSALLLILMSGLTMFGVSALEPSEEPVEAEEDIELEEVEGGSSPLEEALSPEIDDTVSADEDADEVAETGDSEAPVDPDADTITGSETGDAINAGAGDDVVDGGAGDDSITGGAGADVLAGGLGSDILYGGELNNLDDGEADTLSGGEGDDELNLGNDDIATGGEGADTFVREVSMTSRALVTDFDAAEDLIVVQHESDTPPTLETQTIASDGVILEFSDGSRIELEGLTEALDEALISFVDTRVT